jgi:hypothetical protein
MGLWCRHNVERPLVGKLVQRYIRRDWDPWTDSMAILGEASWHVQITATIDIWWNRKFGTRDIWTLSDRPCSRSFSA